MTGAGKFANFLLCFRHGTILTIDSSFTEFDGLDVTLVLRSMTVFAGERQYMNINERERSRYVIAMSFGIEWLH